MLSDWINVVTILFALNCHVEGVKIDIIIHCVVADPRDVTYVTCSARDIAPGTRKHLHTMSELASIS